MFCVLVKLETREKTEVGPKVTFSGIKSHRESENDYTVTFFLSVNNRNY